MMNSPHQALPPAKPSEEMIEGMTHAIRDGMRAALSLKQLREIVLTHTPGAQEDATYRDLLGRAFDEACSRTRRSDESKSRPNFEAIDFDRKKRDALVCGVVLMLAGILLWFHGGLGLMVMGLPLVIIGLKG